MNGIFEVLKKKQKGPSIGEIAYGHCQSVFSADDRHKDKDFFRLGKLITVGDATNLAIFFSKEGAKE